MDRNKITYLQKGSLEGLENLQTLYLFNNTIMQMEDGIFNNTKFLRYLNIGNNNLVSLSAGLFSGLRYLNVLYLYNNQIAHLAKGVFDDLENLLKLDLSTNEITNLSTGILNLKNLRFLEISYNMIRRIEKGAFHKNLRLLDLHKNKLTKIENGVFGGMKILIYISLSGNRITQLEREAFSDNVALQYLRLQDNRITHLECGIFNNTQSLNNLELPFNQVRYVEKGVFLGSKNLLYLHLLYNKITRLEEGTFKGAFKIILMRLEFNEITNLEEGVFDDNYNIEKLYLHDNKITHLHANVFKNNKRLQLIDLQNNRIAYLGFGLFSNMYYVNSIRLYNNMLTRLERGTFNNLPWLISIELQNNTLEYVEDWTFTRTQRLTHIFLHGNRLYNLSYGAMSGFGNAFILTANNNQLSYINLNTTPYLVYVFLENNKIPGLYNQTFQSTLMLEIISISHNPLKFIERGVFSKLSRLKLVILLNTYIIKPLALWTLSTNASFVISQNVKEKQNYFTFFIVGIEVILRSMGYVCVSETKFIVKCQPCYSGSFIDDSLKHCVDCPAGGFYQDELAYTGAKVYGLGCKQCPRGTYVRIEMAPGKSQSDCKSCEEGTNLKEYASFRACSCLKDHYRLDRFGPCYACKKGYVCTAEGVDLAAEFFWVWSANETLQNYLNFKEDLNTTGINYRIRKFEGNIPDAYACPSAESCVGGTLAQCSLGYAGPLCAVCDTGYTFVMTKCQECPSLPWIIVQVVLFFAFVVLLLCFSIWKTKKEQNNTGSVRSISDIFLARLKIIIGFYQVSSSTFESFSYVKWPPSILTFMKYAKVAQLNLLQIIPLNCLHNNFRTEAYVFFLTTAFITLATGVTGPLINFFITRYFNRKSFVNALEKRMEVNQHRLKCYRCFVLILFMTFPSTCTSVFQLLPATCHKICSFNNQNCNSYLKSDYSVQCDTAKYLVYGTLSTVALIYCIGFPLVLFFVLKRALNKVDNSESVVLGSLRFLYENYSSSCWFWEILELLRKMSFSAILILMNAESRTSLGLTAMISGFYSVFFALYKPIQNRFEYWLQLVSLMASSVNFTVGMLMKIPKEDSTSGITNEVDELIIAVLLIATNVTVIVLVAVQYLSSITAKLIDLKKKPRCDVSCCLEMLQLVNDAHGEATTIYTEPKITRQNLGRNNNIPTLED